MKINFFATYEAQHVSRVFCPVILTRIGCNGFFQISFRVCITDLSPTLRLYPANGKRDGLAIRCRDMMPMKRCKQHPMVAWILLLIIVDATLFHQPDEEAFHNPTSWQHDEALLGFELWMMPSPELCMIEELPHSLHEGFLFPSVTPSAKVMSKLMELRQKNRRRSALLHRGLD